MLVSARKPTTDELYEVPWDWDEPVNHGTRRLYVRTVGRSDGEPVIYVDSFLAAAELVSVGRLIARQRPRERRSLRRTRTASRAGPDDPSHPG